LKPEQAARFEAWKHNWPATYTLLTTRLMSDTIETMWLEIDQAGVSAVARALASHYEPFPCPLCKRHRLLHEGHKLRCEKCEREWSCEDGDDPVSEAQEAHKIAMDLVARQTRAAVDARREAQPLLDRIREWSKAYPLDVFPEPDMKKAAKALKAVGLTLDAVSASNMRHVITRLMEDVPGQAAWIKCPRECGEFVCTIHEMHVFECPCPPIEEWKVNPYKKPTYRPIPKGNWWS
jgi:hypothetical protein